MLPPLCHSEVSEPAASARWLDPALHKAMEPQLTLGFLLVNKCLLGGALSPESSNVASRKSLFSGQHVSVFKKRLLFLFC